jgi:hypothetical protein
MNEAHYKEVRKTLELTDLAGIVCGEPENYPGLSELSVLVLYASGVDSAHVLCVFFSHLSGRRIVQNVMT